MDTQQLRQIEQSLIDELFANPTQQTHPAPLQLTAPQSEPMRPYYRGPSPQKIQCRQIEDQLRALVEASTAQLYEMLMARLDEIEARQIEAEQRRIEAEQQRRLLEIAPATRISPPCTPSRDNSLY